MDSQSRQFLQAATAVAVVMVVEAVATAEVAAVTWVEADLTSAVAVPLTLAVAVDISVAATLARHLRVAFDREASAVESRTVDQ